MRFDRSDRDYLAEVHGAKHEWLPLFEPGDLMVMFNNRFRGWVVVVELDLELLEVTVRPWGGTRTARVGVEELLDIRQLIGARVKLADGPELEIVGWESAAHGEQGIQGLLTMRQLDGKPYEGLWAWSAVEQLSGIRATHEI